MTVKTLDLKDRLVVPYRVSSIEGEESRPGQVCGAAARRGVKTKQHKKLITPLVSHSQCIVGSRSAIVWLIID